MYHHHRYFCPSDSFFLVLVDCKYCFRFSFLEGGLGCRETSPVGLYSGFLLTHKGLLLLGAQKALVG